MYSNVLYCCVRVCTVVYAFIISLLCCKSNKSPKNIDNCQGICYNISGFSPHVKYCQLYAACVLHIKPAVLSAAGFLFAPREPQKIIVFNGSGFFYSRPLLLYPKIAAVTLSVLLF